MNRAGLAIGVASFLAASNVAARPIAPTILCETYATSPLCVAAPPCSTCHVSENPPSWNAFGLDLGALLDDDLDDAGYAAALPGALEAVAGKDSDGDGFDNIDELNAGSLPGDAESKPGAAGCPPDPASLDYSICVYDPRLVFKRVHRDFCGKSPSYEAYKTFVALPEAEQKAELHAALDACLDSEFWLGKDGVVWQMAHRKIRPVGALKGGEDAGFLPLADYFNDYALFVYAQIDDHDARSVLLADFFVKRTDNPTRYEVTYDQNPSGCDGQCTEPMDVDRRAGMITTRWMLLYNIMFTALPRALAAQAYRSYLGLDIARMEGLFPIEGEPKNYDGTGVDQEACATCHSTLDPLMYPFRNYNGLTGGKRAQYVTERLEDFFEDDFPGIGATPESGFLFGQPVADLREWAEVAANSDEFAMATVRDYWMLFIGRAPTAEEADEFEALWKGLRSKNAWSVERVLADLIKTEAYGVP